MEPSRHAARDTNNEDKENSMPVPTDMTNNMAISNENDDKSNDEFFKDVQDKNAKNLEKLLLKRANLENDVQQQKMLNENAKKTIEILEDEFKNLKNSLDVEISNISSLNEEIELLKEEIAHGEQLSDSVDTESTLVGIELIDMTTILMKDFSAGHLPQNDKSMDEEKEIVAIISKCTENVKKLAIGIKNIEQKIQELHDNNEAFTKIKPLL